MPSRVTFKMDFREWDRAVPAYMSVTERALPDVLNKKAYYIARRSLWGTPAVSKETISNELGQIVRKGKKSQIVSLTPSRTSGAPLAALIVNRDLKRAGKPGISGEAMKEAIMKLIARRQRSRAFLKAGWLPAIKTLQFSFTGSRAGLPPMDKSAHQFGRPKGEARAAKTGLICTAMIENFASGPKETHEALHTYGGPAFQKAVDDEANSMLEEVARRQYEGARKVGIKAVASL